jgi:PAS domain S-box-containing protein
MVLTRKKILAIEADHVHLEMLSALSKNVLPEFIFLTALDNQKGFELAQSEDPEVIILDFDEALTDDFSLCRRLKNDRALIGIPIVLLISPQTKADDRNKAFQAGVDSFLSKPLDQGQLAILLMTMVKVKAANTLHQLGQARFTDIFTQHSLEFRHKINHSKKADSAMVDLAIKYRILLEQSRDGIVILEKNGKVYEANRRFADMLGYSLNELKRLHVWDWDSRLSIAQLQEMLETVNESGNHFETRNRRRDGTVFDVEINTNGTYFDGQKLIFCICRDITENKKSEQALRIASETARKSVNILHMALQAGNLGTFELDLISNIGVCSEELEAIYGVHPGELNGKPRQVWEELVVGEDLPLTRLAIQASIEQGRPVSAIYRIRRRDNAQIRWVESRGQIILGPDLRPLRITGLIMDITERKQIEQTLQESEQRFRLMAEHAQDLIYRIRLVPELKFEYVSPSSTSITGYTPAEHYADPELGFKLVHPDDRQLLQSLIQPANRPFNTIELRWIKKDGTVIWTEQKNTLILDESGKIVAVDGLARDITERKKAEAALKEANQLFATVANTSTALVWMSGVDKLCTWFNEPWLKFTGRTMEQEMGNGWSEGVHPDDFVRCLKTYTEAFDKRQPFSLEYRLRRFDGQYRWILDPGIPRYDSAGGFAGYIGSCFDITESKLAEITLKESVIFNSALMNNTPYPMFVADGDSSIRFVNPAFEELTGFSNLELTGQKVPYPWWPEETKAEFTNLDVKERTAASYFTNVERLYRKKNGETMWIILNTRRVDDEHTPAYYVIAWLDITQRKKVEIALNHSRELMRYTIEHNQSAVAVHDRDLKFVYVSRRFLDEYRVKEKDVIGKHHYEVFPDSPQKWREVHQRALAGEITRAEDDPLVHKDGSVDWTRWECRPWYQSDGSVGGIIIYTEVITQRKLAEAKIIEMEALKRISQAKSDLLANVSHELRTPLASIKGFIETLMETDVKWSKKQQIDFLQSANKEADRLTFLIRDLLDMSRIESGKLTLDKHSCQVNEILESASGILSIITAKHKLEIKISLDLPLVQADKVRIGQVITNLAENATKFSPEGSQIKIEARLIDGNVIISVQDSGIGMIPAVVVDLFNRFYQANEVVSGKTRGTGLGLSICKGIVEAHGGKIWVDSQEGNGSKFSFSLPVV